MKFCCRFHPWKRQSSENEPNSLFKTKGSSGPHPGRLPLCRDKKWLREPFKFRTNYEPHKNETGATVSSASELVSAQSLQRWVFSMSHFRSSFSSWPSLPHSLPLAAALSPPPFSSPERSCISLLPFPLLIIQTSSPLLPIHLFGWGMPFCNRYGPKRRLWLQFEKTKDSWGELNVLDESGKRLIWGNKNTFFFYFHIF